MKEMTDIHGSMKTLTESEEREQMKPSTVAAKMGVENTAVAPVEAPSVPVGAPPVGVATPNTPSVEGGQREAVLTPYEKAVEAARNIENPSRSVYDGDTYRDEGGRNRLNGVDTPEINQPFGKEARAFTAKFLETRDCEITVRGKDVYGRNIVDVVDKKTGEHLSEALIKAGLGWHFEGGRSDMSESLRLAEERAREAKSGVFGNGGVLEPREFRRVGMSDYQNDLFDWLMKRNLENVQKVYTPEALKAMGKLHSEEKGKRDKEFLKSVKVEAAPVFNIDATVAELAGIGFSYKNRGMDVSDIRPQDLDRAIRVLSKNLKYNAQYIRDEGYDDPYDFALSKIKSAMGIVETQKRRQMAFMSKPVVEQQQEINEAFYGDAKEKYTWFDSDQVKSYMESMTTRGIVENAIQNGMTANEAYIAAVIALGEDLGEDIHRSRLSMLPIESAKKVASLAGALRAQYDGNAFVKGFLSFANSVEGIVRNVKAVAKGDAFGVASESYILDVLSQGLEDTIIDNEDSFWGEVATVAGSSIPVMALLTVPKVGLAVYAANCYGEASRIPIQEDWHNADPAKTEVFKVTYAASAPFIEKGVLGLAMAPLSSAVKAGHIFGPRIAGMIGGKSLAMHLAGAETRGAMSKIAKGISLTTNRALVSAYGGEIFEEVAEQAILDAGGAFVDPTSAEGKKLYGLERFANGIIDAAWTSIKTGPFLTFPFAAAGVSQEAVNLSRRVNLRESMAYAAGDKRSVLEIRQDAVNAIAALDARMRAKTVGGLEGGELARFYLADAETRKRMLEETQDKNKRKWLGEVDLYLRYKEDFEKRSFGGGEGTAEDIGPTEKPKPNTSPTSKIREAAANPEEERGAEGGTETGTETSGAQKEGTEGTKETEGTEGTQEEKPQTKPEAESKPETKPENESFENGTPVPKENGEGSGNAETNEGSGRNAASPLSEETKNPPRREGGENGVPEKGGRTGTPHAEADTGDSSQTGGGVKPVEGNKEEQGGTKPTFVPDTSEQITDSGAPIPVSPEQNRRQAVYEEDRRAAKQEEQRRNLESLEPGASTKKTVPIKARRKITSEALAPIAKKLKRLIEKGGTVSEEEAKKFVAEVEKVVGAVADKYGVADEKGELKLKELRLAVKKLLDAANVKSGFDPVEAFNMLKPLFDWSVKLNKKRATPESSKNAEKIASESEKSSFKALRERRGLPGIKSTWSKPVDTYGSKFWSLNGVFRALSPEISAAYGGKTPEGVTVNPSLVAAFKSAIEEEAKTGVAIMDVFASLYGRKLITATSDMDGNKDFLDDPFGWAEAALDHIVELAKRSADGDVSADDALDRLFVGAKTFNARSRRTGKIEEHPQLRQFADFAKTWLRSVFGEGANIHFVEELDGSDAEQLYVIDAFEKMGGRANAVLFGSSGNVYVSVNANPIKVLHEVLGHATWQWMKKHDAKGYALLVEAAENAPKLIKDFVEKNYGAPDPSLTGEEAEAAKDAYLDEVFAHLMEIRYGGKVASVFAKTEDRAWYERVWSMISEAFMKLWRATFGESAYDSPDAMMDALSRRFFGHGGLEMKTDAANDGGIRFSKTRPMFDSDWKDPIDARKMYGEFLEGESTEDSALEDEVSGIFAENSAFGVEDFINDLNGYNDSEQQKEARRTGEDPSYSQAVEGDVSEENKNEDGESEGEGVEDWMIKDLVDVLNDPFRGMPTRAPENEFNSGFSMIEKGAALRPSGISPNYTWENNPYNLFWEYDAFEEHIFDALERAGISYVKSQGEASAQSELDRYKNGKDGMRREVAEKLYDVFKAVSAVQLGSRVSSTDDFCADMMKRVAEAKRIANKHKKSGEGSAESRKLDYDGAMKEIDAAEEVVALMYQQSDTYLTGARVLSGYISNLRPNVMRIGKLDSELLSSDYQNFGIDEIEGRDVSGSDSSIILQENDFESPLEDIDIGLWNLVRTYDAVQEFKELLADKIPWRKNKYLEAQFNELFDSVEAAEKVAEDEWRYKLTMLEYARLKRQRYSNGVLEYPDDDIAIDEARRRAQHKRGLFEWVQDQAKARKERANFRAKMSMEARKRKWKDFTNRHEEIGKKLASAKVIPSKGMLWVIRYLEVDDDLRRSKDKRVRPELYDSKAKPLSDETRKAIEANVANWCKHVEKVRPEKGETQEEYDRREKNAWATNMARDAAGRMYRAYKAAKRNGKVYADSVEWAELQAARRAYSELMDAKTFVNPRNPIKGIDEQIAAAKERCDNALAAYNALPEEVRNNEPHSLSRGVWSAMFEYETKNGTEKADAFGRALDEVVAKVYGGDLNNVDFGFSPPDFSGEIDRAGDGYSKAVRVADIYLKEYRELEDFEREYKKTERAMLELHDELKRSPKDEAEIEKKLDEMAERAVELNKAIDEAKKRVDEAKRAARSVLGFMSESAMAMRRDAEDELADLARFRFDSERGVWVRKESRDFMEVYDKMPVGLRKLIRENRKLPEGKRKSDSSIVVEWAFPRNAVKVYKPGKDGGAAEEEVRNLQLQERGWVGMVEELSQGEYNMLKAEAYSKVRRYVGYKALAERIHSGLVPNGNPNADTEAYIRDQISRYDEDAKEAWKKKTNRRFKEASFFGSNPELRRLRDEGFMSEENEESLVDSWKTNLRATDELVSRFGFKGAGTAVDINKFKIRKSARFSVGNIENAESTAEPNPVPKFRAKQYSKTIDFAAAFLMRMLADGSYDLDEKLCRNIAYTLDPYMGGETLRQCIEAAKIIAKIVRNEPGVEKLSDDELLELVITKVETIKGDLLTKLADVIHDVQTDTWKSIAESYRARMERYERTGRDEEYGTLSIDELQKLGITSEGTSSNLSSDGSTKQRLTKDSFNGLNRKVYKLLFGADWPRREDYDNDEDFAKAKKAYALKVKSTATPEVLAKYRNTLVWLYGKYGTDSWLRRFFQPSAAAQVRMLVGKLRDTADTVEDIFLFAERIETILSQSKRNLSTEAMVDSIRTMIEPFLKDADPRTALKKRKISPKALEFLKAVYEGMAELTDEKLIAMIPDVRGLSETDLKAKLDALRAEVIAKKADEAAKESEDEGALGGDKKPNAVRAIAALSRQAGYRLVLPYLRLNGRGEDAKNPERTPIQIREEMDKIYAETARVIAEGTQEVKDHIKEQDAMIESFLGKVISSLSKGKSGKVNNSATKESALNEILKKFGALTVSGFSLKQRLAELLRYADEDTRSELSALFDEFINTPVAKAESDQSRYYLRAREAMNRMILKVYSGSKNAGVGEVAAILQMLNTQMDELARFSEDGQTPLTRAQVMAQIAMLRQESVQAPVAELARKLKTGEMVRTKAELTEEMAARGVKVLADQDRAMLKRLEQLDDMIATLDKLSDGKDLKLIDEMVRYYAELAPRIDATAMKITGMAVTTGETGFFPVRRSSEWASRSTERSNRVIGLVPDYLSPRRNTTTDIAQDADIFSIFSDQAEKNAHFLAFGELHYRLSALFENGDWSHLTNRILGKEGAKMLKDHVQDVCAPNLIFIDNSGDNSFWSMARKWVSIALLGGNVLVAAKQMTSVSAFAHEIGWARLAKAAMSNPLSEEMRAARKELFESPEARMRWGDVWLSVQDAVMSRPGKKAKVAAAFAYYMSLQRLGDKVPSWFVAPAVYLANYNALRSRVNPDTGAPFTESEAKARAREMVFDMIEKTQQTSRVSDMAHSQRRGQALGQLWTQFMSSSILFFSSEARAIRDAAANPKNLDSWKRLTGIIVSNHIVTPTLLKGAELLAKKLLQGEDPDDDDLESWIAMLCAGPLSGLVVLGNILTNDRYGDVSAPTVSFFGRVVKNLKKLSVHTVTGEFDEALGDVHKLIASLIPAYRDGSKLYKTYIKTYIEED